MRTIVVPQSLAGKEHNLSPIAASYLDELRDGGGTLTFEKGEYHFYEEAARRMDVAPCYNTSEEKPVAFPIENMHDITVDGNGSVFVFHGRVSPVYARRSQNAVFKNAIFDTSYSSMVDVKATEITSEGFTLALDRKQNPVRVEDGHLIFEREGYAIDTSKRKLSLHATETINIKYLFAGDCSEPKTKLAAPFMDTDAVDNGDTITFRYRPDSEITYPYALGETIIINLEEQRFRSVFVLDDCREVLLDAITIRRGGGFGVLAQLSENVTIRGMRTDKTFHGNRMSLTADALHIVNCSGTFTFCDSDLASFLDDACNIHGTYAVYDACENGVLRAHLGHRSHNFFAFFKDGDRVDFIDDKTLDIVGHATVSNMTFADDKGYDFTMTIDDPEGLDAVRPGFFIENPTRMPEVIFRNNTLADYPNIRLSGAGKMMIEKNRFADCCSAFFLCDLAAYWYEAGRIRDITIRDNVFDHCNKLGDNTFIWTGVSGFENREAPRIHGKLTVTGNTFCGLKKQAIASCGFREVVFENNVLEDGSPIPAEAVIIE